VYKADAFAKGKSMQILLISNSTLHRRGYLDHVAESLQQIFGGARRVVFLPHALFDRDAYAMKVEQRFHELGLELMSAHRASDQRAAVAAADGIFVGGGNTFRLLDSLHRSSLIDVIRERVRAGIPYVGSSAGSIVAGPTIMTTKDMPIVQPPSFTSLGLVPFQISPHYLDPDPSSTHMGETQQERILQFLEENDRTVVGLREGSFIECDDQVAVLRGPFSARVFRRGHEPVEVAPQADLRQLA
jgi:dipeptidase E